MLVAYYRHSGLEGWPQSIALLLAYATKYTKYDRTLHNGNLLRAFFHTVL